jgi:Domain of Unknown Function (DUF1521)
MSFPMIGLGLQANASLQFGPMEPFGSPGMQSTDFMAAFRRHHHHHHDCNQGGDPSCGQGNDQLEDIGQNLMQDGQQLVQEGQQLIQQGDFQQGMQLVREGARLEQQGAQLESQGGQGTDPCNQMPGGQMPGGPWGSMGGQDPCNPMNGQYGSQYPTGMNGCGDNNFGGGYGQNCGCGQLSVNGNTVNTGRYTIAASTDNSGTLTVTDNETGKNFKVWGDPHISTDNGGSADFQHAPATFKLPDGTEITVDPTNNAGVNTINNVTITKGNDAVTMTGFTNGNLKTTHLPGEGRYLDATTQDGIVLRTANGQIDDLVLPDGTQINGNNAGDIDRYASDNNTSQSLGQLQQTIAQLEQEISQIEQGLFMNTGFASFGAMFG